MNLIKITQPIHKYNINDSPVKIKNLDISQIKDIEFFINQSFSPFAFGVIKNYNSLMALILSLNRKTIELVQFDHESLNRATEGYY